MNDDLKDPSQGSTSGEEAASREDLLALARNWLQNDPDLAYSRAKKDANRLHLRLTPRLFSEARRTLGITAGPPRPSVKRTAAGREKTHMNAKEKTQTPMSAYVMEYLRAHPDAEYGALKAAAAQKGFKIAPIVFGRARKELGMAPMAKKSPGRPTGAPRGPRRGPGRRASGGSLSADLGGVLGRLQEMASERDRFHDALEEIARVIRSVL
jgi:hypothetical protein